MGFNATDHVGTGLINRRAWDSGGDGNNGTVLAPKIGVTAICACIVACCPMEGVDDSGSGCLNAVDSCGGFLSAIDS